MLYEKQTWVDGAAGETPLSAERLNHVEDGVAAASLTADVATARVTELEEDFTAASGQITTLGQNMDNLGGRVTTAETSLAGKANAVHTHTSAEVSDATDQQTGGAIVRRSAGGTFRINSVVALSAPTQVDHLTRKDYVDGLGTSAATVNTVVRRDASGNFSANNFTANQVYVSGAQDTASGNSLARKDYVDAQVASVSGGGGGASLFGGVTLDSFAGATDDAKLTAALSYVAAQTVKPPIVFGNRQYSFSQANRAVFSGLKLTGAFGHGNQQRAANSIPNDIRFTGAGTWWMLPASGNIYDVGLYGLSFQGNSASQFMGSGGAVLWTSVFRDLGFNLWKHVLGNPTVPLLLTANLFDGWWNTNNGYDTAYSIGGSDNNLWMDGMLMDSEPANMADTAYHMRFDYMEKSSVGPMFVTCDQNPGILVMGSESRGPLVFFGQGRAEGRNTSTPSFGANIRVHSGHATFRDWWVSYGMSNPAGAAYTSSGGLIHVSNGRVLLDGIMTSRAAGVAETVPFIYQSGGKVRVRNIMTCDAGGTWTGLPRFRTVGGTYSADDSVTVVTV